VSDAPRVGVLGVGLIGGSLAMAARQRLGAYVTGFDPSAVAVDRAAELGAIDAAAGAPAGAIDGAQAVFVAAPVGALPAVVRDALRLAGEDCVISDVGSVKRAIVEAIEDPRFVGGHPLAGAETSGVEHARADLFDGARWYLTPTSLTSGILYERLHRLLTGIGAQPCAIEAGQHDRMLAAVSHLPHVLANVLVERAAAAGGEEGGQLPATGPSFRDATRVAGAPSSIWADIYLGNADALAVELDATIAHLETVRSSLRAADRGEIVEWNERSAAARRRLQDAGTGARNLVELRAAVPNRPGVVAELALELGRAGVNISDMALYPAPDMSEGVVALWIGGTDAAARAEALIAELGYPVARP
jgi:prephenate dehydrogenase